MQSAQALSNAVHPRVESNQSAYLNGFEILILFYICHDCINEVLH